MKTNVKLDVSDEIRNALAILIAGKQVKRLASREDVTAFVTGALEGLLQTAQPIDEDEPVRRSRSAEPRSQSLTADEERTIARLQKEGRDEGYIRGWIYAGRKLSGREVRA